MAPWWNSHLFTVPEPVDGLFSLLHFQHCKGTTFFFRFQISAIDLERFSAQTLRIESNWDLSVVPMLSTLHSDASYASWRCLPLYSARHSREPRKIFRRALPGIGTKYRAEHAFLLDSAATLPQRHFATLSTLTNAQTIPL